MEHARALGLLGSNNLGVGVDSMLISKGEGIQGLDEGGILTTENFQGQTFRSPQKGFWESLGIQSSEELMETVRP